MRIVKIIKIRHMLLMASSSIVSLCLGFPVVGIQAAFAQACPANSCTGNTVVNANSSGYFGPATWYFRDNTTVNLTASDTMIYSPGAGGISDYTYFYNNSTLNVNKEAAISGGLQNIIGADVTVNVNAARGITDGQMTFHGGTLNVLAANGVTGGAYMIIGDNTVANFKVANAFSSSNGLVLVARSTSAGGTVNAAVTGAIKGNVSYQGGGTLNILAHNALVTTAGVYFNSSFGVDGGTMLLNGYNQSLYEISYTSETKTAIIANNGAAASTLTLTGDNNPSSTEGRVFKGDIKNSTNGAAGVLNLVKSGAQTLILSGKSTYTGSTTLNAGILRAGSSTGLAANTEYTVSGGTLDLNNFDLSMSRLSGAGGSITLGNAALSVNQTSNTSFAGNISGTGGLAKSGTGTLSLSGRNTWTGGTTVNAGTLRAASAGGFIDNGAYVLNGGTLDLNNYALSISSLRGTGGAISLGSANLTLNQATDTTYVGTITGTGSVTKQGIGHTTLSGVNTYGGGTIINAGSLTGTATSFGTGQITNNSGLVFAQENTGTYAGAIGGTGSLTKTGRGTLKLTGAATYQGNTTITGGALDVAGAFSIDSGRTLSITSGATNPVLMADTLSIGSGARFNLSGITDRSQLDKVLITTNNGITGDFANVTIGGFAGSVDYMTLNTRKSDDGMNYLAAYDLSWTAGNNLAHGTFTLADAANEITIGTVLSNQAANAAAAWDGQTLTKAGAGTLILSGDNTYSGATNVNAGRLQIGNGGTTGAVSGSIVNNGTLTFNRSNQIIASNAISGTGDLVQAGSGTLILSGINTYSGGTTIGAGTLSVGDDYNLGAATADLIFNGGALSVTSGFDSTRNLTFNSNAAINVATGQTFGVGGQISGGGSLLKTGAGTLRLDNLANSYIDTMISEGTLIGNAASIRGNIGNAGTLVIGQATNAVLAANVAGYGNANGTVVKQGAGTLTLQGTSTLDWRIAAGGLTTAAERFSGNALIGVGALLTFDQNSSARAATALTGQGDFIKQGSGTLELTADSSSFAGLTQVAAGKLVVNGKLGGSLDVTNGGVLGGGGALGSGQGSLARFESGATLSPGNSIGTLTIDGDLHMAAGSVFHVEVDPSTSASDLVHVTGTANLLGGTVAHVGSQGNYNLRSRYTILSANGGLTGAFTAVTTDFAFLNPALIYNNSAGSVDLQLHRNNVKFTDKAVSPNQNATAAAIENIGVDSANPIFDAIALLPDDRALIRSSLDQLSGEFYASSRGALLNQSSHARMAAMSRLQQSFGDAPATQTPILAYSPQNISTSASAAAVEDLLNIDDTQYFAAWGLAFGGWATVDGDGNAHTSASAIGGFSTGIDAVIQDDWRVGVMVGHSRSTFKTHDLRSSGNSENYTLGAYAGTQYETLMGDIGLRAGLAHTWHDMDMSRTIAFRGFDDKLSATYHGDTFQVFGEFGYKLNVAPDSVIEPYVNLTSVRVSTDPFKEKSDKSAALNVRGSTSDATISTLGFRASTNFELNGLTTIARTDLGWRHAFGAGASRSTASFIDSEAFTVTSAGGDADVAFIGAGLDFQLSKSATMGVTYQGQFASGSTQHGVKANFDIRF